MYASRVVEHRPAGEFFAAPVHPYAGALLDALPERAFQPIPGHPPMLTDLPAGCAFAPRCPSTQDICGTLPALVAGAACHHPIGGPT
jgi:peptide/nickel transport system ATP-binding protein